MGDNLGSKWLTHGWNVLDVDSDFLAGARIKDGQGSHRMMSYSVSQSTLLWSEGGP